ncbi:hypothetical protein BXZ70DRAFT_737327 [Cristinia sonorae]|uniref:RING-type domain-containing protein n=1 Tax=Cristinia sonorae TaxID=1940300 RepID=A0A8K0XS86_9AGAR|nr:hypothetical protein BXZ70DRAFT_737327 [Cristinia sonorae]
MRFEAVQDYNLHIKVSHQMITCSLCTILFPSRESRELHIQNAPGHYFCMICDNIGFNGSNDLQSHMEQYHPPVGEGSDAQDSTDDWCDICQKPSNLQTEQLGSSTVQDPITEIYRTMPYQGSTLSMEALILSFDSPSVSSIGTIEPVIVSRPHSDILGTRSPSPSIELPLVTASLVQEDVPKGDSSSREEARPGMPANVSQSTPRTHHDRAVAERAMEFKTTATPTGIHLSSESAFAHSKGDKSQSTKSTQTANSDVTPDHVPPLQSVFPVNFSLRCGCCHAPPVDPITTLCGHVFCCRCALEEVARTLRCPTCQSPVFVRLLV